MLRLRRPSCGLSTRNCLNLLHRRGVRLLSPARRGNRPGSGPGPGSVFLEGQRSGPARNRPLVLVDPGGARRANGLHLDGPEACRRCEGTGVRRREHFTRVHNVASAGADGTQLLPRRPAAHASAARGGQKRHGVRRRQRRTNLRNPRYAGSLSGWDVYQRIESAR